MGAIGGVEAIEAAEAAETVGAVEAVGAVEDVDSCAEGSGWVGCGWRVENTLTKAAFIQRGRHTHGKQRTA